jgi:hypothetical protein
VANPWSPVPTTTTNNNNNNNTALSRFCPSASVSMCVLLLCTALLQLLSITDNNTTHPILSFMRNEAERRRTPTTTHIGVRTENYYSFSNTQCPTNPNKTSSKPPCRWAPDWYAFPSPPS